MLSLLKRGGYLKPITVVLSLLLVVMLAFCAFFYVGGTLRADAQSVSANAASYPEAFKTIADTIANGSAPLVFSTEAPTDASQYTLFDINVALTNRGVFDAEWLNISMEPASGDVAVYSLTGNGLDVAVRSSQQVNLKLLTRAGSASKRRVTVQYYVYGISRTIAFTV